jgi:hypothetical protein
MGMRRKIKNLPYINRIYSWLMEYSLRNLNGKSMALLVFDKKVPSQYAKKLLRVLYPEKRK